MSFDSVSGFAIFFGRTLAGFVSAIILAFVGDLTGRITNLLLGYPWWQGFHVNLHLVSIGIGAGIGAYLGWMSLKMNLYQRLGTLGLVVLVAIIGVYLGRALGPGVDPTYWWSRFAVDISIHIGAAAGGIAAATLIRLTEWWVSLRQDPSGPRRSAMTTEPPVASSGRE